MRDPPAVSVLIPAFNAGRFLNKAVSSILDQTFSDFELIIIDDGSTDDSFAEVSRIRDPRIKIVRNDRNEGLIAARNKALSYARAPLLACLDADDVAMPTRLECQTQAFRKNPGLALLGSCAYLINEDGVAFDTVDVPGCDREIRLEIFRGNKIIHSSVMMRTDVVRSLGGYPNEYGLAEDYALWLRVISTHTVENLQERLIQYRVHKNQVSQSRLKQMWLVTSTVRADAWQSAQSLERTAGMLPPRAHTFWSRLTGDVGSFGRDCLYWARIYRRMGCWPHTLTFLLRGLLSAPLCASLYAVLLPTRASTKPIQRQAR